MKSIITKYHEKSINDLSKEVSDLNIEILKFGALPRIEQEKNVNILGKKKKERARILTVINQKLKQQ